MIIKKINLFIIITILYVLFLPVTNAFANADTNSINWNNYIDNINDKINSNWRPPQEAGVKNVVVSYEIDKAGDLINYEIIESSGSILSDNAAIEAIKNSAPFEPLPEEYKGKSLSVEYKFKHNFIDCTEEKSYDEYDDKKLSQWKAYMHNLNNQIKTNWVLLNANNSDKIVTNITISKAGKLLESEILESNETDDINRTVLSAIENSAPFEPLPEDFDGESITVEYLFDNTEEEAEEEAEPLSFADFSTRTPEWKEYMKRLNSTVVSNWIPPTKKTDNRTVVVFSINKDGTLTSCEITETSLSQEADKNAADAIFNSAPFEPLPENYAGESVSIKFIFDKNTVYNATNNPKTKYIPMDNTDILFFLNSLNKQKPKKEKKRKQKDKDHYKEETPEH